MDPVEILKEFYCPGSKGFDTLIRHSEQVTQKALDITGQVAHLKPDPIFITEAAMLHDIGIFKTTAQNLGCHGPHPYLCHGTLGRFILDEKGLPLHGLVCERHVGVGISAEQVVCHDLPLPVRDMRPVSIDEQIICYADKFFSKNDNDREKSVDAVLKEIEAYGPMQVDQFKTWLELFGT